MNAILAAREASSRLFLLAFDGKSLSWYFELKRIRFSIIEQPSRSVRSAHGHSVRNVLGKVLVGLLARRALPTAVELHFNDRWQAPWVCQQQASGLPRRALCPVAVAEHVNLVTNGMNGFAMHVPNSAGRAKGALVRVLYDTGRQASVQPKVPQPFFLFLILPKLRDLLELLMRRMRGRSISTRWASAAQTKDLNPQYSLRYPGKAPSWTLTESLQRRSNHVGRTANQMTGADARPSPRRPRRWYRSCARARYWLLTAGSSLANTSPVARSACA